MNPVPNDASTTTSGIDSEPDLAFHAALLTINMDLAARGLPLLQIDPAELDTIDTELGLKKWIKGQINNPKFEALIERDLLGRFARKIRARITPEERKPRVHLRRDQEPPAVDPLTSGQPATPELQRRRKLPEAKMQRLSSDEAIKQLQDMGLSEGTATRRARGGNVYKIESPTGNPVFFYIASPRQMVENRTQHQLAKVVAANRAIEAFDRHKESKIKRLRNLKHNGKPKHSKEEIVSILVAERGKLQAEYNQAEREYKDAVRRAERAFGKTSDGISARDETKAAQIADLLLTELDELPEWQRVGPDGRPKGYLLQFDESRLVTTPSGVIDYHFLERHAEADPSGRKSMGVSEQKREIITFNRARVYEKPSYDDGHWIPAGKSTAVEHTVPHEFGHTIDGRDTPWSSEKPEFRKFRETTLKAQPGAYAETNPREWFAEMYTLSRANPWQLDDRQRIIAAAFRNMFLLNEDVRPPKPGRNWTQANEQWLAAALAALSAGRPLPPLPDAADFFKDFRRPPPKKRVPAPW